jgi:hypothetical protein
MLPDVWKKPTKAEAPSGYVLQHLDGGDIPGEPPCSTIDEALRRAARRSRLEPTEPVMVRDAAPPRRIRAVAQVGLSWWVATCKPCGGGGQVSSAGLYGSSWHECARCGGTGWVTDSVAARG